MAFAHVKIGVSLHSLSCLISYLNRIILVSITNMLLKHMAILGTVLLSNSPGFSYAMQVRVEQP